MSDDALLAACRTSFDAFAERVFYEIEPCNVYEWNWHIGCIAEHLEALHTGVIKRLIINLPPRFLKSYLVARAYPAWILGKNPEHKFICTSYGYEVAEQNSIACKRIMQSEFYKKLFPETEIKGLDRNTHFETKSGGQYYAASALSPLTGMGCGTMICDDLLKPNEALSQTVREATNANMRNTFFSRFNDKRIGKFVMVSQRLHVDDPAGHLLADGGYVHLKLPVYAPKPILITLGDKYWAMKQGELLSPERVTQDIIDQDLKDMGAYNFAGQMMQDPVPAGGGEFRKDWLQWYDNGSISIARMNIAILVDPAGGEETNKRKKKLSDYTAMMVVGLGQDNNYYLLDIVRDRLNATERINKLFELHRKWNSLTGKAPKVGYEKYGLMTDTHYIKEKQKQDTYRFPVIELGGRVSKEDRIRRLIPDMENGRWYFPESGISVQTQDGLYINLVQELVDTELLNFPKSRYDDMSDALARIYDKELNMNFPALQKNMVTIECEKQYKRKRNSTSWIDL